MSAPFQSSHDKCPAKEPIPFKDPSTGFSGFRIPIDKVRPIPTPAVADGRLYVGRGFGSFHFYAFDAHTGVQAWNLRTKDDGPTAGVLADGFVVFNTESCTLEVVEALTGEIAWEKWLGDPLLAQPAVMDGRVFMAYPARRGKHELGAFALRNGTPLWQTELTHDVITAPVVAEGKVYLSTLDGKVWCIEPATGKVVWTQDLQATSAPWVFEGDVYVARRRNATSGERRAGAPEGMATHTGPPEESPDANIREAISRHDSGSGRWKSSSSEKRALYLSRSSGAAHKAQYHMADSSVGFSTPPSSAKLETSEQLIGEALVSRTWRFQGSRPVVVNRIQYDTVGDKLEATDILTGETLWSWQDAVLTEGERTLTPPAVANGRVWAGTWDGRIISWDALTGEIRWQVRVKAPCHWQPVVSEGWVYAGLEDGTLVGFATGDPLDTDWPMWGGGCGHNGKPHPQFKSKTEPPEPATPKQTRDIPSRVPEPTNV